MVDAATRPRTADALSERPSLLGGVLCLNFINSADPQPVGATEVEYLGDYAGLVSWGDYVGAVSEEEADGLRRAAAAQPAEAEATWRRALNLRALLARLFGAVADDHEPDDSR